MYLHAVSVCSKLIGSSDFDQKKSEKKNQLQSSMYQFSLSSDSESSDVSTNKWWFQIKAS